MSHRTQITLTDAQYTRLIEESRRSGVGLAELVRRALDAHYGTPSAEDFLHALDESFGSWTDRDFDGAEYVERLRRGLARRLADQ